MLEWQRLCITYSLISSRETNPEGARPDLGHLVAGNTARMPGCLLALGLGSLSA